MEASVRNDIFEPGDLTALVCLDQLDQQQMVADQLSSVDYKIHAVLEYEDVINRLQTYPYNVVVIGENFLSDSLGNNQVYLHAIYLPAEQRRNQFLVLVGPNLVTNDEMVAFIYSVDLVFNDSDLSSLKPILRRGVARQKEFFHAYNEASSALRFGAAKSPLH